MIVKVSMPTGTQVQARITTKDGSTRWKVSADIVGRRFADKTEKIGYFSASLDEKTGSLEIGDRVYPPVNEAW